MLLDERGKSITSEGMAQLIAEVCASMVVVISIYANPTAHCNLQVQAGDRNADSLVFCIGGPFGHSNDLRAQANKMVKLSDMVLNHQVQFVLVSNAHARCNQMHCCKTH